MTADSNFKNDLFEAKGQTKKGRKSGHLNAYFRQRFLPYVKVPIEYTVIISIVVLVLIIVSYAAGIERGRALEGERGRSVTEEERRMIANPAVKVPRAVGIKEVPREDIAVARKVEKEEKKEPERPSVSVKEELRERMVKAKKSPPVGDAGVENSGAQAGYVVQLASFKERPPAVKELARVEEKGYAARVVRKGDWYQLYATGFPTMAQARGAREGLIPDYKDCFIRKIY